jgi:hypothetical protein
MLVYRDVDRDGIWNWNESVDALLAATTQRGFQYSIESGFSLSCPVQSGAPTRFR